jgi:hypothetical protein
VVKRIKGWRKAEFEIQKYIKSIGQKNIISMHHHFEGDKKFTLVLERGLCSLTELMDHYTFNQDPAYMPRTKKTLLEELYSRQRIGCDAPVNS